MNMNRYLFVMLILLTLNGCGVNNIPTYDEEVIAAWGQVENQYKRRADLVPNLVNTVKGFAAQEKEVLTAVVEARSKVSQVNISKEMLSDPEAFKVYQNNQDALSSALSRLMVVVEKYPELKSNQNYLALQSQLEGTENRIAVARRDYIGAVRKYNTELRTYPGRWWKALLYPEAEIKETFSAPEEDHEVPVVEF